MLPPSSPIAPQGRRENGCPQWPTPAARGHEATHTSSGHKLRGREKDVASRGHHRTREIKLLAKDGRLGTRNLNPSSPSPENRAALGCQD